MRSSPSRAHAHSGPGASPFSEGSAPQEPLQPLPPPGLLEEPQRPTARCSGRAAQSWGAEAASRVPGQAPHLLRRGTGFLTPNWNLGARREGGTPWSSLPVSAEGDLRPGGWSADTPRARRHTQGQPSKVRECVQSAANFPGVAHRSLQGSQATAPAQDGSPSSARGPPPLRAHPRPPAPDPRPPRRRSRPCPVGAVSRLRPRPPSPVPRRPRHSPHSPALPS